MRADRLILVTLVVSFGFSADAHRGVERGTSCAAVESIETRLGAELIGRSTSSASIFFKGTHLNYPATIAYRCNADLVTSQIITVDLSSEQEGRVAFADFKRALQKELGAPYKDLDERTVSELRENLLVPDLPLERATTWVRGHRVVTLMLGGRRDSWQLALSGP